jgi:hypothetical protein
LFEAPPLGWHSREILKEIGYGPRFEELVTAGVVVTAEEHCDCWRSGCHFRDQAAGKVLLDITRTHESIPWSALFLKCLWKYG